MAEKRIVTTANADKGLWRDLTAYWFFGLCNNFGYVVMLTAAYDILNELSGKTVSFLKVMKSLTLSFNFRKVKRTMMIIYYLESDHALC